MKRKLFTAYLILLIISTAAIAAETKTNPAVTPAHRHNWWTIRHHQVNERVKQGNIDLIFIGDSITHGWEGNGDPGWSCGQKVWQKYYSRRNAVNMGFSGDRTQHVLWRLDNGNIDNISPKVAVIMIGTNNTPRNPAEQIAEGLVDICEKLRKKLPDTKILLLAIFPREKTPGQLREKITKTNNLASKIADGKMIHYLDISPKFLQPDNSISKDVMPDYLHLSKKGYQIWAQAIEPKLVELLSEKK